VDVELLNLERLVLNAVKLNHLWDQVLVPRSRVGYNRITNSEGVVVNGEREDIASGLVDDAEPVPKSRSDLCHREGNLRTGLEATFAVHGSGIGDAERRENLAQNQANYIQERSRTERHRHRGYR
jgi:hypothetical protein